MDMELALPQSMFRTYIAMDTLDFGTDYYVEAPLKTPEEWDLSQGIFCGMISLDTSRFYDTEIAARPQSYVIIPSELDTDDRRLIGFPCLSLQPTRCTFAIQSGLLYQHRCVL